MPGLAREGFSPFTDFNPDDPYAYFPVDETDDPDALAELEAHTATPSPTKREIQSVYMNHDEEGLKWEYLNTSLVRWDHQAGVLSGDNSFYYQRGEEMRKSSLSFYGDEAKKTLEVSLNGAAPGVISAYDFGDLLLPFTKEYATSNLSTVRQDGFIVQREMSELRSSAASDAGVIRFAYHSYVYEGFAGGYRLRYTDSFDVSTGYAGEGRPPRSRGCFITRVAYSYEEQTIAETAKAESPFRGTVMLASPSTPFEVAPLVEISPFSLAIDMVFTRALFTHTHHYRILIDGVLSGESEAKDHAIHLYLDKPNGAGGWIRFEYQYQLT